MKKAAITTGIIFLVLGMIFGVSNVVSYIKMGGNQIKEYAQKQVPISTKIEMLEQKKKDLGPKIDEAKRIVAQQEERVERLSGSIDKKVAVLDKQWQSIVRLRDDLKKDETQYVYSGQTYTKDEVNTDLTKRYERYKGAESALNQEKELLKVRTRLLKENQNALANLKDFEGRLEIMIEKLRARQETIKAKKIDNMETVDDSATGDIKKLYEEVDEALSVEERLIEMEGDDDMGEIKVEETKNLDVLEEIDARRADKAVESADPELIKIEK